MRNKRGAFWFIAIIILAVLLISILASIIFKSIGKSTSSIFEQIKQLIGIEPKKAEASEINAAKDTSKCIVNRYYWGKNSIKIGERVGIIIEGEGDCNGKSGSINIFKKKMFWDEIIALDPQFNPRFNQNEILVEWVPKEKGSFYFQFIFRKLNKDSKEVQISSSGVLKVE